MNRPADVAIYNIVEKTTIILDVRTCAMPASGVRIKDLNPLQIGARDKYDHYAKTCEFPAHVKLIPICVDTYGRFGNEFLEFLSWYCKRAAKGDQVFYDLLITRARTIIAAAHANSVGRILRRAMETCVSESDHAILAQRAIG